MGNLLKTDMLAFGARLKKTRERINMSQDELGEMVGLKKSSVSRYENGSIKSLDIDVAQKFAEALGVSVGNLLNWREISHPDRKIPVLGTIAAGLPLYAEQNICEYLLFPHPAAAALAWPIVVMLHIMTAVSLCNKYILLYEYSIDNYYKSIV